MSLQIALFLDFDDTLSAHADFDLQYARAIGQALTLRYGGDTEAWLRCATEMLMQVGDEYNARFRGTPINDYCQWLQDMRRRASAMALAGMGLAAPEDPAGLTLSLQREALLRCNALLPDAEEAVKALHRSGLPLHMASGNDSAHLDAALEAAGLDRYIQTRFGPDLIDCAKEGPEFYQLLFASMSLPPERALVIDNDPDAIVWAHAAGARAIQVSLVDHSARAASEALYLVEHLSQLPSIVARIAGIPDP